MSLKAPFPYFGGKSQVSDEVWLRFGDINNYVEPFAGSLAVLLGRPLESKKGYETVNDADGLISNFWRSLRRDPSGVCEHANLPINEVDLHARHLWLVKNKEELASKLMADPDWYDIKSAGWWVWGICNWIGSEWCSGDGSWYEQDGLFTQGKPTEGVHKKLPHMGGGRGINRKTIDHPSDLFQPLSKRLEDVRVACGDWSRVLGPTTTISHGVTGVFLDPPYSEGTIDYNEGDRSLSEKVRDWCLEWGEEPKMRIALCGYEGEHDHLEEHGWIAHKWKARGGYGNQGDGQGKDNASRERIWFSPNCLNPEDLSGTMLGGFMVSNSLEKED